MVPDVHIPGLTLEILSATKKTVRIILGLHGSGACESTPSYSHVRVMRIDIAMVTVQRPPVSCVRHVRVVSVCLILYCDLQLRELFMQEPKLTHRTGSDATAECRPEIKELHEFTAHVSRVCVCT